MAGLYDSQLLIAIEIEKIGVNLKKAGIQRRTIEYLKKCMDNLEDFWKEYQFNHDRLSTEVSKTHDYFVKQEYEKTKRSYQAVKALINQMYQKQMEIPSGSEAKDQRTESKYSQEEEEEQLQQEDGEPQGQVQTTRQPWMANQGTNSKLDDMLRKQAANFKAFRRTVSNINLESISDKWEFEDVLKTLQTRWSAIDTLHWEIDSEMNDENSEYERTFNSHEQQYNSLKKAINTKMWSVSHREKSTPKLEIPIFSGNYNQWTSFKDLFQEAIHNNSSLSNAQKMQFLKGKVKGEAERLIQHLQISVENYSVCWDILNHRYNNKNLIFSSHMNILLGLPNMPNQSLPQIKKLHDTTLECLHAIKHLGVDTTSWDPMVVHILSQKLDSTSHTEYIESRKNSRELPTLQEFLNFLETKFISLENSRRRQDNPQQKQYHQHNQPQSGTPKKNYYSHNYNNSNTNNGFSKKSLHVANIKCPMCNAEHGLYNCKSFLELSVEQKLNTAQKLQVCINCLFSHNGSKCTSTKRCRKCTACHNTLLHDAFIKPSNTQPQGAQVSNKQATKHNEHAVNTSHVSSNDCAEILLATALVKVRAADGSYHILRALIDQGSQISLITENAAQLLKIQRQNCKGIVIGVGEKESNCKGTINITFKSLYSDYTLVTNALIMNNLLKNLPNSTFTKPSWSITENINLADPEYYISRPVDLLLGAEVYADIIMGGIIKGEHSSQPIAQQTHLGWILCGGVKTFHCNVVLNNLENIQTFWEVEDISEPSMLSLEDQECIAFYLKTTNRLENGRYEVRLPLKTNIENKLGSSKQMALAQFRNLERKFKKQDNLATHYKTFMKEYSELRHMQPTVLGNTTQECYLPHHGVQREESTTTKYRVVFNASAKTSSGFSLNDLMHKGPNLQQDLQSLLLKWRQYQYVYTADIEKMYRQIGIHESDQPLQKIFWRDSPEQPIQTFQLATVTYGTKAAPFLAIMTLKKLATDEKNKYPDAAQVLESSFYMDDLVHGSHSIGQAKRLISELITLLKTGGFNLRKWASNQPTLIEDITKYQNPNEDVFFNMKSDTSKTLGLCWNSSADKFFFRCDISKQTSKITKRTLLSEISKLFDPLGWLTPLSTKLKILFQKLWKNNLQWDDEVSEDIYNEWSKIKTDIDNIHRCEIPRWLQNSEDDVIEIHGFCDASIDAYACVAYARIKQKSNIVLIAAKSKLVPHKKALTLPKLELSGAYLLSKLINKIRQCLSNKLEIYGWTDSMVALSWIQGEPNRWKPFVANRVNKITNIMPPESWRYVKSIDNPADCASRGLMASQLVQHALWWQGPAWLLTWTSNTENEKPTYDTNEEVKKNIKKVNTVQDCTNIVDQLLEKHNNFNKITRVLAWVCRALQPQHNRKQLPSYLTLQELRHSKTIIVKHVQNYEYGPEIEALKKYGKLKSKSKLLNLNPFIDQNGLLRVGGRLKNANMSEEMRHPKIIPHNCRLADLLIDEAHLLTFHGGPRVTLANLRQQYWITSGNNATKKRIRRCVVCRKYETGKPYQLMGDLPQERSNPAPPFYHTGVDYTGFVEIKTNKGRGVKTTKGYVAVFICMATKAVHLELVSDLSSSAFLAALKRMAARRGAPRHLYSDQGTNFVGANNILEQEYQQLQQIFSDSFLTEITELKIEWHFNAPSWPSAGGLWERAVRSLKFHLKRVIGAQKLTFEEFTTILAQLEACLNSRPLCPITENIEDLDFLTPAHFLTGRSGLTVIETEDDARTRWHLVRKLFEDIWKKWKAEYLSQLTARSKWLKPQRNYKIGDLVVIQENNIPAGKWAMGRVVDLHPGKDGMVRVVSLKTKNGILKRPIIKLSLLPIGTADEQKGSCNQQSDQKQDTQVKEGRCKRTRRQCRVNFISVALALTFFMTLISNTLGIYNITQLRNNQSLYFDSIAKMKLIRDKWTLVVYYDMAPYWEGTTAFKKLKTHLDKTCTSIDSGVCNMIVPQLWHEFEEVRYYNTLLMTHPFSPHSRQRERRRRGLINGVGYVANYMFGVLDQHFAEQYTKDITLLKTNQQHLAKLWKNQTSIVESEYNLLQRTERIVSSHHKNINQHLNKLENITHGVKLVMTNLSVAQEQIITVLTASTLLQSLRRTQDALLDTLTDIRHGQFNMHLLTPEQLKQELNVIAGQLSDDITLPVEQTDISKLFHLLQIKARMTEKYFIFQITFPLISRYQYKLYRVIPIPKQLTKNNMTNIIPISEYIGVNLKKDAYVALHAEDLSTCVTQEEAYMCLLKKPIYHLGNDNSYCNLNHETNQCKVEQNVCSNKWIPLYNPSEYLFYSCYNYSIKIICGDHVTVQLISGAGVIYLGQGCVIKGPDFTLHSNTNFDNSLTINSSIYVPNIDQLNNIINVNIPTATEINDQNITYDKSFNDDLQKLYSQIKQMNYSEIESQDILSPHDIHHYAISYTLMAIAVVVAAAFLWRWRRRRMRRALINSDIELQSVYNIASASARQRNTADRQPKGQSEVQVCVVKKQNKACSPIPKRHLGTLSS